MSDDAKDDGFFDRVVDRLFPVTPDPGSFADIAISTFTSRASFATKFTIHSGSGVS